MPDSVTHHISHWRDGVDAHTLRAMGCQHRFSPFLRCFIES